VSLFSPGLVVLDHVNGWLKAAREQGEFKGRTVFIRKDGSMFTADIRITPTWREGQQIGYCGVTTPLPDVPVAEAMPAISRAARFFRWLVITRAPFLTASLIPILAGAAWVVATGAATPFPWLPFALALIAGMALHVAANTFNDYFDWTAGTDRVNNDYFLPYSGGSRSIELGLISERTLFRLALASLGVAAAIGAALILAFNRPLLAIFGLVGAFSAYFYTAPPLRLAARRGLGELLVGLNFGPLMVAGTVYALTGTLSWLDFFVGLPIGLLVTAILWINQFPDYAADKATGKINLVVVLGTDQARWGYLLIVFGAFAAVIVGVAGGLLPVSALVMLLALPIAVSTTLRMFRTYRERSLVAANANTINLHFVSGLLLALGLFFAGPVNSLLRL
jgi:1,4-dihydroxy-2-naphthoate octaprenyltransferase